MKRAGVVRDHEVALKRQGGKLLEAGPAAKIDQADRTERPAHGVDQRSIARRTHRNERRPKLRGRPAADLGKMLRRPPFGKPARAGVENHTRARRFRKLRPCPIMIFGADWYVEFRLGSGRTERPSNAKRPIHCVDALTGRSHQVCVEASRPFTRIGHADSHPGSRGRDQDCRTKEALEIDRQIKTPIPQPLTQSQKSVRGACNLGSTAPSIEDEDLIKATVAPHDILVRTAHNPGNMRIRPTMS